MTEKKVTAAIIEHIHDAADEMVETFHQSSVLIQANQTTTEFYSGKN